MLSSRPLTPPGRARLVVLFCCSILCALAAGAEAVSVAGAQAAAAAALEDLVAQRPDRWLDPSYAEDPARLLWQPRPGAGDGEPLRLDVDDSVSVDLSGLDPGGAWTISFRARLVDVARAAPQSLVRVPGCVEVRVGGGSGVVLRAGADSGHKRIRKEILPAGEQWVHVTVAYDARDLRGVRVVVDDQAMATELDGLALPDQAARIELAAGSLAVELADLVVLERAVMTNEVFRRTCMPLDPYEMEPPLEETLPLPVQALEAPDLMRWGVTRHLAQASGALRQVPAQWEQLVVQPGVLPLARTTHVTLGLGDGRVLLFGSEAKDTHVKPMQNTDDTWILDLAEARWTRIATEAPLPGGRCHQTAAYDPERGLVFYPGGLRNDVRPSRVHADAWILDVEQESWAGAALPAALRRPVVDSIVFFRPADRLFYGVFEGRLVAWDPAASRLVGSRLLRALDEEGRPIDARLAGSSQTTLYDAERDRALVFGGESLKADSLGPWTPGAEEPWVFTNRTWWLDPETATLRLVDCEASYPARVRAACGQDPRTGHVVMFGGVRDQRSTRFGDLWVFDPEAETWSEARQANPPGRRGGFYGMPYDPTFERFVLTHGRSDVKRFHDDTWLLDYDPSAPGTGRWLFDRRGHAGLDALEVVGTAAPPEAVAVEVRAGAAQDALRPLDLAAGETFGPQDRFVEVRVAIGADADWGLERIGFRASGVTDGSGWTLAGAPLRDD